MNHLQERYPDLKIVSYDVKKNSKNSSSSAETIEVDLEKIIEEGGSIPKLRDGDIVNVPFNWRSDYKEFLFFTSIFTSITGLIVSVALLTR